MTDAEKLNDDYRKVSRTLDTESDLAAALIGASFLDRCLYTLLRTKMKKSRITDEILNPQKGFAGNMQARAELAYAFHLIGKSIFTDLVIIERVRNHFAHTPMLESFGDEQISDLCEQLVSASGQKSPRGKFTDAIKEISLHLIDQINSAQTVS